MNSVRVNLLPEEVNQKNAARRTQGIAAGVGVGVLAVLAGVYVWQVGQVNAAQEELEVQEAEVARLQAEVNDLSEFQRLADQGQVMDQIIVSLLAGEASVAGVLQDLAAVMPSDTSINTLAIAVSPDGTGTVTSAGQSLLGHAPGLERLLISLDKVASFQDVFFASSSLDETGVSTFSFNFELTPLILTGRYAEGLPEVMR